MDWEWYQDPVASRLFIHLILKANFVDKKWQGVKINRGQIITSQKNLAQELGLTLQNIRTALINLQKSKNLTIKTTNKFSLITIEKYGYWQDIQFIPNSQKLSQTTYKKHSNNNQSTTTKQNNQNTIEQRKKEFKEHVYAHSHFNNKTLEDFFCYWSELDKDKKSMRWESENHFEIATRLSSWLKKEKNWAPKTELPKSRPFSSNR